MLCCNHNNISITNIPYYREILNCKYFKLQCSGRGIKITCQADFFPKDYYLLNKVQCSCYIKPYAATDVLYLSVQTVLILPLKLRFDQTKKKQEIQKHYM